jgi:putative flippase GtrA
MSRLSAWSTRLRLLCLEIAKFGVVGGAGVVVSMIIFNLLRSVTDLQTVRANVVATVVAIAFNYVGYRYFTYRHADRSRQGKEVGLFALFSAIGAIIENAVLYAATYGMHWDGPPAANFWKLTGIGLGFLFRFWSYRTWVFTSPPAEPVGQAEAILKQLEPEPEPDVDVQLMAKVHGHR